MAEFNIRSESVDVEQIMKQIRTRIREKRGVDYTEEQIRELATVRLEKFLDPKNLRSDLLEQFRRSRPAIAGEPPPVEPPYTSQCDPHRHQREIAFSDETIYETHRGTLRFLRRLFNPLLKLLFNPNPLIHVIHKQAQFNVDLLKREQRRKIEFDRSRADWNSLYYEVLHNLVLETTRSGIEIKNLKMRLESLASRLDFSERRVRALEGVVQYRPEAVRSRDRGQRGGRPTDTDRRIDDVTTDETVVAPEATSVDAAPSSTPEATGRRRRRRRRGRRGAGITGAPGSAQSGANIAGGESEAMDAADDASEGSDEGDAFEGSSDDQADNQFEADAGLSSEPDAPNNDDEQ